jgi:hypothetical protein
MVGEMTDEQIETVVGEEIKFATRAEYDAFHAGLAWGERLGNEQGWDDGYREGDLVDVEWDEATLTVREKLAAGDVSPADLPDPGMYTVAVHYRGDDGIWKYHGAWTGHATNTPDAERQALDELEDHRIDGWKAEVIDVERDDEAEGEDGDDEDGDDDDG